MTDGTRRTVESYCETCEEVRVHRVDRRDPGAIHCTVCGHDQTLISPLDPV